MFVTYCQTAHQFLEIARANRHIPVVVTRTPTVMPWRVGTAVVMQPVLALDYLLKVLVPAQGEVSYVYQERWPDNGYGLVTLANSLLEKLKAEQPALNVLSRSGSL